MFSVKIITVGLFSTFAIALNANADTKVDCSKADKGEVTIKVVGDRLTLEKGAELAYKCLSVKNKELVSKRKQAIAKSKGDNEPEQCGKSEPLQTLRLTSWLSERPYPVQQPDESLLFSVGGEAKILAREPISCDGVGSGMYSGINQAVSVVLEIEEQATFAMEDDSKPTRQEIQVKLGKSVNL